MGYKLERPATTEHDKEILEPSESVVNVNIEAKIEYSDTTKEDTLLQLGDPVKCDTQFDLISEEFNIPLEKL